MVLITLSLEKVLNVICVVREKILFDSVFTPISIGVFFDTDRTRTK